MKVPRLHLLLVILLACAVLLLIKIYRVRSVLTLPREERPKTVAQRVQEFGPHADTRLAPFFRAKNVAYPPGQLVLIGLKNERRLEVYGSPNLDSPMRFIRTYPILGASGGPGPKLREGDLQVPEGVYRIESLNPNSLFHLGLRIGYPNEWDREHAKDEGRTDLGGDIMIHGSSASIGCLAMGDEAAEDLFVLAARTGLKTFAFYSAPLISAKLLRQLCNQRHRGSWNFIRDFNAN